MTSRLANYTSPSLHVHITVNHPDLNLFTSLTSTSTDTMKSRAEAEKEVASWGFRHIFTWTDGGNAYYPPHSHSGLTTHLILRGQLTISYPDDPHIEKETFGPGARVDGMIQTRW